MYKAGIDALANAILDNPRFVVMLIALALNEYLAKQTETFTEIVKKKRRKNKTRNNKTFHHHRTITKHS